MAANPGGGGGGGWYTSPPIIWYHPLQYLKIYPPNILTEKNNKNIENKQEIGMVGWKTMLILKFCTRFLGKLIVRPKKKSTHFCQWNQPPTPKKIKKIGFFRTYFRNIPPILNTDLRPCIYIFYSPWVNLQYLGEMFGVVNCMLISAPDAIKL